MLVKSIHCCSCATQMDGGWNWQLATRFSQLGFKYWIWTQFWWEVEVACLLADWGSEYLPPNNRVGGWAILYTYRFLMTRPTARMPVTGNADQSRKDSSRQRVRLRWFPVVPILCSWGLWGLWRLLLTLVLSHGIDRLILRWLSRSLSWLLFILSFWFICVPLCYESNLNVVHDSIIAFAQSGATSDLLQTSWDWRPPV